MHVLIVLKHKHIFMEALLFARVMLSAQVQCGLDSVRKVIINRERCFSFLHKYGNIHGNGRLIERQTNQATYSKASIHNDCCNKIITINLLGPELNQQSGKKMNTVSSQLSLMLGGVPVPPSMFGSAYPSSIHVLVSIPVPSMFCGVPVPSMF